MKKILAVVMTLVLAFTFCISSSADFMEDLTGILESIFGSEIDIPSVDELGSILEGLLADLGIGGGEDEGDGETPTLPDMSETTISPEAAERIVSIMLQTGASKEDIQATFDQMHEDGQLNDESYWNLTKALLVAEEPEVTTPSVDDSEVPEVAQRVIDALRQAGVSDDQMQSVVDQLYERGVIPQNVYDAITNILNAEEDNTEEESSGGISGVFDRIKDFFSGLFGGSSEGEGSEGEGSEGGLSSLLPGGSNNPTSFGAKEPTGDTAVTSVVAVAAVAAIAGAALMLTKKKKEQ